MTYNIHGTGTVEFEAEKEKDATEKFDYLSSEQLINDADFQHGIELYEIEESE